MVTRPLGDRAVEHADQNWAVEVLWKKWPHAVHLANSQSQLFRNQCGLNNTKAITERKWEVVMKAPMSSPWGRWNATTYRETSRTNHLGTLGITQLFDVHVFILSTMSTGHFWRSNYPDEVVINKTAEID